MSLEIDNLDYIKYLVEYAINKNNKKICMDLDLDISCWLGEIDDIKFSKEIIEIIENSNTEESWWKHTLNPENLKDHTRYPTHTSFDLMIEEMYKYLLEHPKAKIVCADDPSILAIGYLVWEETRKGEIVKNYTISFCNAKEASSKFKKIFMVDSPRSRMDILKQMSKFYGVELKNKYGA